MGDTAIILLSIAIISGAIFAGFFCSLFQDDVRAWMRRTIGIGPRGLELNPPDQQQARVNALERVQQQALTAPAAPPNPGLEHWQAQVQRAINNSGHRGTPALVPDLENTLAIAARLIDFHITARWIFGTQIAALRALEAAPAGCSLDDLRPTFQEHVTRVEHSNNPNFVPDILQWIGFLPNQHLVTFQDGRYHINAAGRDFLQFTVTNGINEGKAL
jgi:hypothetical protein